MASNSVLTPNDVKLLCVVFQYALDSPESLKVNFKKLAEHGGFNGVHSASSRWSKLKAKLMQKDNAEGDSPNGKTPKKSPKRKEAPDDDASPSPTPSKKKRTPKTSPKAAKEESNDGTGQGDLFE